MKLTRRIYMPTGGQFNKYQVHFKNELRIKEESQETSFPSGDCRIMENTFELSKRALSSRKNRGRGVWN